MRKKEAAEEFAVQLSEALAKAREHFDEEKRVLREQLNDVHKKELDAARAMPRQIVKVMLIDYLRRTSAINLFYWCGRFFYYFIAG